MPSADCSRRTTSGVSMSKWAASVARSSRLRSLMSAKSTDAALVDPLKDLPGVKTRLPEIVEGLFQFGQFDAGDVGSRLCHHGAP